MAYDTSAAAELDNPEAGASEERGDTFFLPESFPGKEDYKPGDTITLKVVGQDADGGLEVECVHEKDGEKPWQDDMRDTMGPEMKGAV